MVNIFGVFHDVRISWMQFSGAWHAVRENYVWEGNYSEVLLSSSRVVSGCCWNQWNLRFSVRVITHPGYQRKGNEIRREWECCCWVTVFFAQLFLLSIITKPYFHLFLKYQYSHGIWESFWGWNMGWRNVHVITLFHSVGKGSYFSKSDRKYIYVSSWVWAC